MRCAAALAGVAAGVPDATAELALLEPAQGDAGGEHREKAVALRQARQAVGEADQAEGEKVVEADCFLVDAAQIEHELADRGAQCRADRDATGHAPDHVEREPAPAAVADVVQPEQTQAEQHHRKRSAVVEAGLAGEGEAQAIAVARLGHLHVGREHRVGRREDAAEQDRRAERQAEREHAEARDQRDRDQHRDDRQSHRQQPAPVAEARAHLQTRAEQREQDHDFGEPLEPLGMRSRGERSPAEPERAHGNAGKQVQHRGAERQAREQGIAERHDDQQEADDGRPRGDFH